MNKPNGAPSSITWQLFLVASTLVVLVLSKNRVCCAFPMTFSIFPDDDTLVHEVLFKTNRSVSDEDGDEDLDNSMRVSLKGQQGKGEHRRQQKYLRSLQGDGDEGGLQTTRTFPQCIEQKLSPEECQEFIEGLIANAGGHEVGDDLIVKVRTPRTPEQLKEGYWMVEVPVNVYDEVACDRNNGFTHYPFPWEQPNNSDEAITIENQNCYGLTGAECCLQLRAYGRELTESGYDANGQCLSCFVHREPLLPVKDGISGEIEFLDYRNNDDSNNGCIQEQLTEDEVDALDEDTAASVVSAIEALEQFHNAHSCDNFELGLLSALYGAASMIHPLSLEVGRFACHVCYGGEQDLNLDDPLVSQMVENMLTILRTNNPPKKNSKEKVIIIHTTADGEQVAKDPTFGNGQSDLSSLPPVQQTKSPMSSPPLETDAPTPATPISTSTSAPTQGPTSKTSSGNSCPEDPSLICDEGEYCTNEGSSRYQCVPNTCIQDPTICADDEYCAFQPDYFTNDFYYECQPNTCIEDPSLCVEGEYCRFTVLNEQTGDGTYSCGPNTCFQDPSLCDAETEYCQELDDPWVAVYDCREITCLQDPALCSETQLCIPDYYADNYYTFQCVDNVCITDPPEECTANNLECIPVPNPSLYKCSDPVED